MMMLMTGPADILHIIVWKQTLPINISSVIKLRGKFYRIFYCLLLHESADFLDNILNHFSSDKLFNVLVEYQRKLCVTFDFSRAKYCFKQFKKQNIPKKQKTKKALIKENFTTRFNWKSTRRKNCPSLSLNSQIESSSSQNKW